MTPSSMRTAASKERSPAARPAAQQGKLAVFAPKSASTSASASPAALTDSTSGRPALAGMVEDFGSTLWVPSRGICRYASHPRPRSSKACAPH